MKKSLLLFFFLVISVTVFSRAGGGSSSGGHGGGFSGGSYGYGYHHYYYYGHGNGELSPFVTFLLFTLPFVFVALAFFGFAISSQWSYKKTKSKIAASKKFDAFWDATNMENHVREIFPKIQAAWMSRELKDVSDIVTMRFIGRFQPLLNDYKRRKLINVIDQVQIHQVKIMRIHDDADNSKDRFSAYIKGRLRDYITHESGGITGTMQLRESHEFEDAYIFYRKDQQWLLDNIINDPDSSDFKLS